MLPFETKAKEYFPEIIVDKALFRQAGFESRSIPTYVGEWILSYYLKDLEILNDDIKDKISSFISKYLPSKGQKEEWKNRLLNQEQVNLLDNYTVAINLKTGLRNLIIPFLDIKDAFVIEKIVEDNDLLLKSGVWGVGELFYIPPNSTNNSGQVWMREFKPFQIARVDMDYFIENRKYFDTEEWINLLISSMGFNPTILEPIQKILLITRMIPIVEPRVNLIELAPKGTGKSFVYDNLSRYARVIGGGKLSPAVLFFNNSTNTPGLVTRYDTIVLDEVQSVHDDSTGELIAMLKVYLESGKFSRGKSEGTSEASLVMLANITLDEKLEPLNSETGILNEFPNFLKETAFLDRMHGILKGWYLPRVTKKTPSEFLGFKGDLFAEILHAFRSDIKYMNYVKSNMEIVGCDDLRDFKRISSNVSGFLKLLFPDLKLTKEDFNKYCVKPAIDLRQTVRDELYKMDKEYKKVNITVKE